MTDNYKVIYDYLGAVGNTKENSNNDRSHSGMESYIADEIIKNDALTNLYPPWVGQNYKDGTFHFHNLTKARLPYCFGADLLMLLSRGLISNRVVSKPAKHLDSAVDHMVNFLGMNQQEWAGAQAFSNVNTLLAPLAVGMSYDSIKQQMQRLIYNLNLPSRSGYQTVFSNLVFDFDTPESFKDMPVVIGGDYTGNTYEDYKTESELIHLAFWEALDEGDAVGNPFTFPIPTENLTPDLDWDSDVMRIIIENTRRRGQSYFMNLWGTGRKPGSVHAMCCRLNLDLEELAPAGGRWAMEGGTGSLGVITLNMARIGYLAHSDAELFELIGSRMEMAKLALMRKEEIITYSKDVQGLMPLARFYEVDFNRFFRTIGLLGFEEMFLNYTGSGVLQNLKLAYDVLEYMRAKTKDFQKETGKLWNFEMTPAEGSSWSIALKDKKKYPDIITSGTEDAPYYTAMIPPSNADVPLMKMIKAGDKLLDRFSGGTAFRVFTGDEEPSYGATKQLIMSLAKGTHIPYYDITSTFSVCNDPNCKYEVRGVKDKCPNCNSSMRTFSRTVGYFRSFDNYNEGKLQEAKERVYHNV